MSASNGSGPSPAGGAGHTSQSSPVLSRVRTAWKHVVTLLSPSTYLSVSSSVPTRKASQQQQQQQQSYVVASNANASAATLPLSSSRSSLLPSNLSVGSSTAATPLPSAAAVLNSTQVPGTNCYLTPAANAVFSGSSALELMRAYNMYVRAQKTRWRSFVVFLFALLFFSYCTFYGPQEQGVDGPEGGGYGGDGGVSGGPGMSAGGPGVASGLAVSAGAGPAAKDGTLRAGLSAMDGDGTGENFAGKYQVRRRPFQPPRLVRVLFGSAEAPGRMDMDDVVWWEPSNRTTDTSEPNSERGLNVGTPNAASLSLARSLPPWSVDTRRGFVAFVSRFASRLVKPFLTPEVPSYELALSAFFRTRQAMTEGTCNRCQARAIEHDVRVERIQYRQFLREHKLRVPTLLYYNRLPVYAMIQHLRLMRVRNYQLLDYVSRADSVLRRPETVANDVSNNAALHARELDFELTRLSFVFYLQRLHLRALRHADAMRLETFHFLRHLSSTVPLLRQLWTGQDHCTWTGVSCIIVRVPLNLLIDDDHPAVQAFVEDLFSVCRGPDCTQRRCVPPACGAFTQHLTRRLFTSAAPAYWMKWDRLDDTAAMDEMIFPKATPRKKIGVDAATAVQQQQQQQQQQQAAANSFGAARRASPFQSSTQQVNGVQGLKAEEDSGVHGSPAASVAARANRVTSSTARTVWTEQQFAYEHPSLLLADPLLLVDVDVESIMDEIVRPATPLAQAAKVMAGNSVDPASTYRENIERPLVEDLLPMQKKLLRTIASAAPRGLRFGKQSSSSSSSGPILTIPLTFVMLNLPSMGLRGYLPDFYDTQSTYDVPEAATRSGGASEEEEERTSAQQPSTSAAAAAAATAAGRGRTTQDVRVQDPRSDVYWGRLSRQRMLENRNLSSARLRRSVGSVQLVASDLQRVLRRVEKIGQRNHHEDLAAYFSEVSTLAQFQNERWSPYRWPEAMITVTNAIAQSAAARLYPIVEDNAFSTVFTTPVYNVDHHVEVFGEINPRLVALLAVDISGNPLLSHIFPRTWMSIPFLQSVRTQGSSVLAPPLRMRGRTYNASFYCPLGSGTDETSPYGEDARRSQHRVLADAVQDHTTIASTTATSGDSAVKLKQTSVHDRDYVGSVLLPPFFKVDSALPAGGVEAFFHSTDPLSSQQYLYRNLKATFNDGLWQGIRRLVTQQQDQEEQ